MFDTTMIFSILYFHSSKGADQDVVQTVLELVQLAIVATADAANYVKHLYLASKKNTSKTKQALDDVQKVTKEPLAENTTTTTNTAQENGIVQSSRYIYIYIYIYTSVSKLVLHQRQYFENMLF
jgi:hypothetical protein